MKSNHIKNMLQTKYKYILGLNSLKKNKNSLDQIQILVRYI